MTELDRVLREQAACAELLLAGHPEQRGLRMAVADWMAEEVLLMHERQRTYIDFLEDKQQDKTCAGFKPLWMPSFLFDFQGSVTEWEIEKGKGAIFADCGMGKTPMELVWGENVIRHTNKPVLDLMPLAVGGQTLAEAEKFNIDATRSSGEISGKRIHIANYEKLHLFNPSDFGGVICDESSAIKALNGKRRAQVTEFLRTVPYRLLGTATAAPNDYIELGTSSEALGVMGLTDMLTRFFKNDQNTVDKKMIHRRSPAQGGPVNVGWRFKGHAEIPFFRWVTSWARAGRKPSDFGPFSDAKFVLPELIEREHIVETRTLADGMLFARPAENAAEEREERRRTTQERCEYAASLVLDTGKSAVVWCDTNAEGDLLEKLIQDGKQVAGSTEEEEREEIYSAFAKGQLRVLIIKKKIGAWGMNWQHCSHVVEFVSHSFEQHYQAVRRCWRFGQNETVVNDLIATEGQSAIRDNMQRKASQADRMFTSLLEQMDNANRIEFGYRAEREMEQPKWL